MHENDGATGFSATAASWQLPSGFATNTFESVSDTASGQPYWSLLDLDGGGAADVVVSRLDSTGIAGLGTTSWILYSNACD